jgi:hypothetical protein
VIKEPQVVVHKTNQPDLLRDFLDADILSGEDLTEIYLTPPDADTPALRDGDGAIMQGIFEFAQACVRPRRRTVELAWDSAVQRLI